MDPFQTCLPAGSAVGCWTPAGPVGPPPKDVSWRDPSGLPEMIRRSAFKLILNFLRGPEPWQSAAHAACTGLVRVPKGWLRTGYVTWNRCYAGRVSWPMSAPLRDLYQPNTNYLDASLTWSCSSAQEQAGSSAAAATATRIEKLKIMPQSVTPSIETSVLLV